MFKVLAVVAAALTVLLLLVSADQSWEGPGVSVHARIEARPDGRKGG